MIYFDIKYMIYVFQVFQANFTTTTDTDRLGTPFFQTPKICIFNNKPELSRNYLMCIISVEERIVKKCAIKASV